MEQTAFVADPTRLLIAAAVGIIVLLILIIRFKLHPVISMMIAAIIIGIGAGMPLTMISDTVEKGVGKTLQGIALLVGLGSMFGGILEVSGGAQRVAQTLIDKLGQKKAGIALGITGLVIGTTVFFEAGVVVLIPLAFSIAKQTKKSTLYYAIPLLAGLASGYAFVPPSAGSVLTSDSLGVNLGVMIMVGIPVCFNNMTDAKYLVQIAECCERDVDLICGKYIVDAKSMLGVFSLPQLGNVAMCVDESEKDKVYDKLKSKNLLR